MNGMYLVLKIRKYIAFKIVYLDVDIAIINKLGNQENKIEDYTVNVHTLYTL